MTPQSGPPPPVAAVLPAQPRPLAGIPLPPAVIALGLVTLAAFLVALGRLPRSISDGIDMTRAEHEIERHDGKVANHAIALLEPLAKRYPDSVDVQLDLADGYEQAHLFDKCVKALNSLEPKSLSEDDLKRSKEIVSRLNKDSGGAYTVQGSSTGYTGDSGEGTRP